MTAFNPPSNLFFNGVTFNPTIIEQATSTGLSKAEADASYLKKTVADTATALETFSSGIVTNGIYQTLASGIMSIGYSAGFISLSGAVTVNNSFQTPSIDAAFSGGVFNVACVTPSTINIGTANATAINVGSNGITTNITGTTNIAQNTTGTKNTYIETASSTTTNIIDFHSSGLFDTNYDSRIISSSGSASDGTGILQTFSNNVEMFFNNAIPRALPSLTGIGFGYYNGTDNATTIAGYAPYGGVSIGGCGSSNPLATTTYVQAMCIYPYYGLRLYTGGISFDKGNLTSGYGSGRGSFIQTGTDTQSASIGAASSRVFTVSFTAFGSNPIITLGPIGTSTRTVISGMTYTIYSVSTNSFSYLACNNNAAVATSGTYGVYWTAIGSY